VSPTTERASEERAPTSKGSQGIERRGSSNAAVIGATRKGNSRSRPALLPGPRRSPRLCRVQIHCWRNRQKKCCLAIRCWRIHCSTSRCRSTSCRWTIRRSTTQSWCLRTGTPRQPPRPPRLRRPTPSRWRHMRCQQRERPHPGRALGTCGHGASLTVAVPRWEPGRASRRRTPKGSGDGARARLPSLRPLDREAPSAALHFARWACSRVGRVPPCSRSRVVHLACVQCSLRCSARRAPVRLGREPGVDVRIRRTRHLRLSAHPRDRSVLGPRVGPDIGAAATRAALHKRDAAEDQHSEHAVAGHRSSVALAEAVEDAGGFVADHWCAVRGDDPLKIVPSFIAAAKTRCFEWS